MKEENKAPTTQVSANPNLFNTRKDTGVARVTTRANPTTTTKTTSAVFMAVLLWWMYVNTRDTLNKSVGLCHSTMSPRRERMFGVNDAMDQPTFADLEYDGKKRKTRREIFLERMDSLIPWGQIEERIRPFYPKAGRGRRPYELSVMLRIHCVQLFYNLSDPGRAAISPRIQPCILDCGVRVTILNIMMRFEPRMWT